MDAQSLTAMPPASPVPSSPPSWPKIALEAITAHKALHNPGELATFLALAASLEPATVLEIGTWTGGGSWAWAQIPSIRRLITVDMSPQPGAAERIAAIGPHATLVQGNSLQVATRAQVQAELGDLKADLVIVDGGHDYRTAKTDFEWAGSLARAGGLLMMHDTQGYPGPAVVEVPQLWREIRAVYRTTELVDLPGGPGGTGLVWL